MDLERTVERYIELESKKHIDRFHAYHNALHVEHERKRKRIKGVPAKQLKVPPLWAVERKFDPFYVYARRAQFAKSIANKIRKGQYKPNNPQIKSIPKPSGGERSVTIYQIPDAAVSLMFYQQLLRKNRHRYSSFSYAYRPDRNVHFAIQDISVDLSQSARVFIAEFDFSRFFDSIDHDYLRKQFSRNGFLVSEAEKQVIDGFLLDRSVGIPQGTSLSLFLANVACWPLDKGLEKAGLRFARYADDTVIWSETYEKISEAYRIISEFAATAGVAINTEKSDGISLLCAANMRSEMAARKDKIEFLGYALSAESVAIKSKSVNKIKRQISYILFKHLLQPLSGTKLIAVTIPSGGRDPELLSAILEIRRFLYGNLSEQMIQSYLNGSSTHIFFKGLMSFYPLITDEKQMKELDGWLVTAVHKALGRRAALLQLWGFRRSGVFPFNVSRNGLAGALRNQLVGGRRLMQLPSFFRIYSAIRKGVTDLGLERVTANSSDAYDY